MRIPNPCLALFFFFSWIAAANAVDYSVQLLNEPAPGDEISKEVADLLSPTGVRIMRGSSTAYMDIWPAKALKVAADFKPTSEILYPFTPGQFVGVARVARKGSDFRDQDINVGVYTLRYAQQPVDGAHVGTSLTRDFLLLIEASKDNTSAPLDYKKLTKQSSEAAGSSHPALLSMQRIAADTKEFPSIRHDEERDWWIAAFQVQAEGSSAPLPVELVVVGHAAE